MFSLNRVSDNMQDADYRKGVLKALNKEEILTAAYGSLDYATPATHSFQKQTHTIQKNLKNSIRI